MFLDVSRYLAESTVWRDQAFHRRNRRGIKMQIFTLTAGQSKKAQRQTAGSLSTFESWRHGCIQWRTVSSQHNWGGWPKKTVCNCLMAVCSEPTKLARFAILLLSTWWRATQVFLFAQLQIWSCWNFISKSMASMDIHAVSIVSNYQYIWLIQRRDQKCHYVPTYQTCQSCLIYFGIFWQCLHPYAAHLFAGLATVAIRGRTYYLGILWRQPQFGRWRSIRKAQDGRATGRSRPCLNVQCIVARRHGWSALMPGISCLKMICQAKYMVSCSLLTSEHILTV